MQESYVQQMSIPSFRLYMQQFAHFWVDKKDNLTLPLEILGKKSEYVSTMVSITAKRDKLGSCVLFIAVVQPTSITLETPSKAQELTLQDEDAKIREALTKAAAILRANQL